MTDLYELRLLPGLLLFGLLLLVVLFGLDRVLSFLLLLHGLRFFIFPLRFETVRRVKKVVLALIRRREEDSLRRDPAIPLKLTERNLVIQVDLERVVRGLLRLAFLEKDLHYTLKIDLDN